MLILGLETSCDETAASVVRDGRTVLSNTISSQQKTFSLQGGVIPEEAARKQVELILPVIHQSLIDSGCSWKNIDAIAVTKGPGLLGSLLVGSTAARTLAMLHIKPLIGVHHTLGHLSSTWLEVSDEPAFPMLALSVSGGHSDLWLRESHTKGILLGSTRDDAAGEAFDKGAFLLGLPYPGGPSVAKAAMEGDPDAYEFPLPLKKDPEFDFSFSGLKTSLRYLIEELKSKDPSIANLAASYQKAICAHLVDRIVKALAAHPEVHEIHCVGGVSANTFLREQLAITAPNAIIRTPLKLSYCTDNAAMIAAAGFFLFQETGDQAFEEFETKPAVALMQ